MADSTYRDLWTEFLAIQATTQKKLLKKPNLNEALKQFRDLSMAMEEAGMPDQAGHCHREIAAVHGKLGNLLMERRHQLKAAHLFHSVANLRRKMHLTTSNEFVQLMEECFLAAIERMLKQGCPRIAGLTYVEMSAKFEALEEFAKSFPLLIKANRFLQGDICAQLAILEKMADLVERQPAMEEAMAELLLAWNSLAKTQISDPIRPLLLALEGRILLIRLLQAHPQPPPLLPYDGQWRDVHGNGSVANREEFHTLARLVSLVREQNYLQLAQLFTLELDGLLDAKGRAICRKLLDALNTAPSINHELDEILASDEPEEAKRQAMFEWMATKSSKLKLDDF